MIEIDLSQKCKNKLQSKIDNKFSWSKESRKPQFSFGNATQNINSEKHSGKLQKRMQSLKSDPIDLPSYAQNLKLVDEILSATSNSFVHKSQLSNQSSKIDEKSLLTQEISELVLTDKSNAKLAGLVNQVKGTCSRNMPTNHYDVSFEFETGIIFCLA